MSAISDAIYAAAFVTEFNRLHSAGVHAMFREEGGPHYVADTRARVKAWERWCVKTAHATAEDLLALRLRSGVC